MSAFLRVNFGSGFLDTPLTDVAIAMVVQGGHTLPAVVGSFRAVVWNSSLYSSPVSDPDYEIITASYSGVANNYAIIRAQESTTNKAHVTGCKVSLVLTAGVSTADLSIVGTKEVDETDIDNAKILIYDSGLGKLKYVAVPGGGDMLMSVYDPNSDGVIEPPQVAPGTINLSTGVTGTLPTANGGTGSVAAANAASGVVVLNGSSQLPAVDGSLLTGIGSVSNVIFSYTSPTAWTQDAEGFTQKIWSKFVKIVGISTVTVYAYMKMSSGSYTASCKVDIGGVNQTGTTTSNSYTWVTLPALNVSSLTNGTLYSVSISLNTSEGGWTCSLLSIIGIAS